MTTVFGGSGLASTSASKQKRQPICPTCSCTEIDIVGVSGQAVCVSCGTIVEENNIVSSIEFSESGGGGHSVVGQFVSATSSTSYGNIGTSGRNYGQETRASTLANGKKKIRSIAGMLRLGDHHVDSAYRLFALALQRNFTHGRKSQTVIAACLYVVCRREQSPHLLIDFADKLQLNVYVLGGVFLKFCKLLQIHLPLLDPSLYIHRFASQLQLGAKTHSIATTALRLVATMKRDWMETGRRPSGICGAALLIAARSQSVVCRLQDVMDVVNISERTLKLRLQEFMLTPTAQLTSDQVGKLEMARVECDPPSFRRHREREVMEMLLLEAERLPLMDENQLVRQKKKRMRVEMEEKKEGEEEEEEEDEEDEEDEAGDLEDAREYQQRRKRLRAAVVYKIKQFKDSAMSKFLCRDKRRPAPPLRLAVHRLRPRGRSPSISTGDEKGEEEEEEEEEEIDFGFEDANEQIVNRASRLAAKEALLQVRGRSMRFIMKKRDQLEFYKTIERDLTLALEDGDAMETEGHTESGKENETVANEEREEPVVDTQQTMETHEEEEEEEAMEDEPSQPVVRANEEVEEDQPPAEDDVFSDVDDEEINSLLLSKEEAKRKTLLWEKMNAQYLQEQEEKRLHGLLQPEVVRKKRKKKEPDVNMPPPDTAQHAIYKLKSRRINYEVIDELFGETSREGF